MKTDTNLHKRLKLFTHQQAWYGVRLLRGTCDFLQILQSGSFQKPNWVHPCQESVETVRFWLFVT